MAFYIKEWSDKTASIITHEGRHLFTFANIESASTACRDVYKVTEERIIRDRSICQSVESSVFGYV